MVIKRYANYIGKQFNILTVDDDNAKFKSNNSLKFSRKFHNRSFSSVDESDENILDDKHVSHSLGNLDKGKSKDYEYSNDSLNRTFQPKKNTNYESCYRKISNDSNEKKSKNSYQNKISSGNVKLPENLEKILTITNPNEIIIKKIPNISQFEEIINKENTFNAISNYSLRSSCNNLKIFRNLENIRRMKILNSDRDKRSKSQIISYINITNSHKNRQVNILHENSANYSINIENDVNNNMESNNNLTEYNLEEENKKSKNSTEIEYIIIFRLDENYYIPMKYINYDKENASMTLQYLHNKTTLLNQNDEETTIVVNINELTYEKFNLIALQGIENLNLMEEINFLSIIKNFLVRIDNGYFNFLMQDVYIMLNDRKGKIIVNGNEMNDDFIKDNSYDMIEWYENKVYLNNLNFPIVTLIKNKNNSDNFKKNNQFHIFKEIVRSKNLKLFEKYSEILNFISELNSKLNLTFSIFCNFSNKYRNYFNFNFLPIFPSDSEMIQFGNKSILKISDFNPENKKRKEDLKNQCFSILSLDNIQENLKNLFLEISSDMLDKNFEFIEIIYNLIIKLNIREYFKHIFSLLLINYFFLNFNYYNNKAKIFKVFPQRSNREIFTFYSNTILIFLYIFLFEIVSNKFQSSLNLKILEQNKFSFMNFLLFYNEESNKNSKNFEQFIFQRISEKFQENSLLSDFMESQLNDFLIYFNENYDYDSYSLEIEIIKEVENILDLEYFVDFYKNKNDESQMLNTNSKIYELLNFSFKNSLSNFLTYENKNFTVKQIWVFQFENFSEFVKNEDNATNFVFDNKFVEYSKFFQIKNNYFVGYSIKNFFNKFLPILTDVDIKFNSHKNYKNILSEFLKHLQAFEEFSENFEVTDKEIKLNYISFSILQNLFKNVREEKVILIQRVYRGQTIQKLIAIFRANIRKIQSKWREYKIKKFDYGNVNKCFEYVTNKYNDPILLKIFSKMNKNFLHSQNENKKISEELKETRKRYEMKEKILYQSEDQLDKEKIENNLTKNEVRNSSRRPTSNSKRNTLKSQGLIQEKQNNFKITRNSMNNIETDENKRKLEVKLNNYKIKYKDLVNVVNQHERKIEKFVEIINTNEEIRLVLQKYGIKLN